VRSKLPTPGITFRLDQQENTVTEENITTLPVYNMFEFIFTEEKKIIFIDIRGKSKTSCIRQQLERTTKGRTFFSKI
jgi:hypothetical protein